MTVNIYKQYNTESTYNSRAAHNLYLLVAMSSFFFFSSSRFHKSQILPEYQQLVRLQRRDDSWAQFWSYDRRFFSGERQVSCLITAQTLMLIAVYRTSEIVFRTECYGTTSRSSPANDQHSDHEHAHLRIRVALYFQTFPWPCLHSLWWGWCNARCASHKIPPRSPPSAHASVFFRRYRFMSAYGVRVCLSVCVVMPCTGTTSLSMEWIDKA